MAQRADFQLSCLVSCPCMSNACSLLSCAELNFSELSGLGPGDGTGEPNVDFRTLSMKVSSKQGMDV